MSKYLKNKVGGNKKTKRMAHSELGTTNNGSLQSIVNSTSNTTMNQFCEDEMPVEHSLLGGKEWTPPAKSSELLFNIRDLEREKVEEMYRERLDFDVPIEMERITYPQIDNIPISVIANPQRIWNFCVAYCATAMYRKGSADDMITLIGGGSIGMWYFGALTLFYSIYECTVGAIPPLQRISSELADLFRAVSPCIKNNRAYTVTWGTSNIISLMATLPYQSYAQPLITLAPWTGLLDAVGRRIITNTPVVWTLDDILEIGPRAFEQVQRYLLADRIPLVSYTTEGNYATNTSAFACSRDDPSHVPIPGFVQVVNESPLPQRDYWLMALQFFGTGAVRDSFHVRTVQVNTHIAMYRILTGSKEVKKSLPHMIDIGCHIAQEMSLFVSAEVNSMEDKTLLDLDSLPVFPSEYLSQVNAGTFLTKVVTDDSRRFGLLSAMSAGDVLTEASATIIGAGSRFVTEGYDDNSVAPLAMVEDLAALSSFIENGVLQLPILVTRGFRLTVDQTNPGGRSLLYWLHSMLPTTQGVVASYNMATPSPTDLPDVLDMSLLACFTSGVKVASAIREFSSVASLLQGSLAIGVASGSRDGPRTKHLFLTHVIEYNGPPPNGYNVTPTLIVNSVLSTQAFNAMCVATLISRCMSVFYTAVGGDRVPAFQTLYNRPHSSPVDLEYTSYRSPEWLAEGHKNAANMIAPSEQGARAVHDTLLLWGGSFVDVFLKNGKWVTALENLAEGMGSLFSPTAGKIAKSLAGLSGQALHKAFMKSGHSQLHLAPVTNRIIPYDVYMAKLQIHKRSKPLVKKN